MFLDKSIVLKECPFRDYFGCEGKVFCSVSEYYNSDKKSSICNGIEDDRCWLKKHGKITVSVKE